MDATAAPLLPIPTEPEAAIRHLVCVIGRGFHPDTPACDYVTATGAEAFAPPETTAIDGAVVLALATLGERVYEIALDEMEKLP